MSVALPAKALSAFEIKSANLPMVALLLKSGDLAQLAQSFAAHYGDMPAFFDQDPLLIDLGFLNGGSFGEGLVQADQAAPPAPEAFVTALEFSSLNSLLRQYRLQPLAVRGGSEAQNVAAVAAGLALASDAFIIKPKAKPASQSSTDELSEPIAPMVSQATAQAATPVLPLGALVIDKPLRSGQQVYARGRDLVVMAMVNPGAEVIADGHIHVYAPLRGKAIAGARGNTEARIVALVMDPELISIAGIYRTSETPLPASVAGKAVQVRLLPAEGGEDKLVFEPISA